MSAYDIPFGAIIFIICISLAGGIIIGCIIQKDIVAGTIAEYICHDKDMELDYAKLDYYQETFKIKCISDDSTTIKFNGGNYDNI